MNAVKVSAPGKLHLLGEHSVVYGNPALLAAVDKRFTVGISTRKEKNIEIISRDMHIHKYIAQDFLMHQTYASQDAWKKDHMALVHTLREDSLLLTSIAIGETLLFYKKKLENGLRIVLKSDIPEGSGMGSSAALAIALVGALTKMIGEKFNKASIQKIAHGIEQKIHGSPSGADGATSCLGGLVWFENSIAKHIPLPTLSNNFFILNTGKPLESTGEMVHGVQEKYRARPQYMQQLMTRQAVLTHMFLKAFQKNDTRVMAQVIQQGEANLEKIGVVGTKTKAIIRHIEKMGFTAKICGAGGKKNTSGVVLVFSANPDGLEKLTQVRGYSLERVCFDTQGVREEYE